MGHCSHMHRRYMLPSCAPAICLDRHNLTKRSQNLTVEVTVLTTVHVLHVADHTRHTLSHGCVVVIPRVVCLQDSECRPIPLCRTVVVTLQIDDLGTLVLGHRDPTLCIHVLRQRNHDVEV